VKPGSLIETLDGICHRELPGLLADPATPWKSLNVTYEDPHVERVWIQLGEYRLMLHRIHPCDRPLKHPHPWPSAIRVLSGQYMMGVGRFGQNGEAEVATLILTAGSRYEMNHPHGWHYVKPLGTPSLSVMLTGKPWPKTTGIKHPGTDQEHTHLAEPVKNELLQEFRKRFPVMVGQAFP